MRSSHHPLESARTILVTGATGYIGGRLVPHLLEAGYNVRVLIRGDRGRLDGREWADKVEVVSANVLDPDSLPSALQGTEVAFYLIHSMTGSTQFRERDRQAAQNFGQAAADAGVKRIIYLGGLGTDSSDLSEHLRSRHETGDILRQYDVSVTEFRAAIVVGSGSVSFEMIRHLTERLPLMICPRWVYTRVQPISVFDLLDYLVAALDTPASAGEIIEVGGANVLSYGEMMLGYAKERELKRRLIPVPLLTPHLSSMWVHLVTPIPSNIAQPLIKGLRNEVIVTDNKARQLFPQIEPVPYCKAVQRALRRLREGDVETIWSDAISSSLGDRKPDEFVEEQGMLIERRERRVEASTDSVFSAFTSLGGSQGWPPHTWLWQIRGLMDRLIGGSGLRRGRRHPHNLREGDALDFWRVEDVTAGECLLLRAEMKLPGRAWLRFTASPCEDKHTLLTQTAFFIPKGLWGLLYWYAVYPLHKIVFPGMIDDLVTRAELLAQSSERAPMNEAL